MSMGCFAWDRNFLSTVRGGCETCGQVVKFCCWSLVLVLTSLFFSAHVCIKCRVGVCLNAKNVMKPESNVDHQRQKGTTIKYQRVSVLSAT